MSTTVADYQWAGAGATVALAAVKCDGDRCRFAGPKRCVYFYVDGEAFALCVLECWPELRARIQAAIDGSP